MSAAGTARQRRPFGRSSRSRHFPRSNVWLPLSHHSNITICGWPEPIAKQPSKSDMVAFRSRTRCSGAAAGSAVPWESTKSFTSTRPRPSHSEKMKSTSSTSFLTFRPVNVHSRHLPPVSYAFTDQSG